MAVQAVYTQEHGGLFQSIISNTDFLLEKHLDWSSMFESISSLQTSSVAYTHTHTGQEILILHSKPQQSSKNSIGYLIPSLGNRQKSLCNINSRK